MSVLFFLFAETWLAVKEEWIGMGKRTGPVWTWEIDFLEGSPLDAWQTDGLDERAISSECLF